MLRRSAENTTMMKILPIISLIAVSSCTYKGKHTYQARCTNEARHPEGHWHGTNYLMDPESAEKEVDQHKISTGFACDSYVKVYKEKAE